MSILKIFSMRVAVGLLLFGLMAGCGAETDSTPGEKAQAVSGSADGSQTSLAAGGTLDQKILGVWLGEAILDEGLVEQKLQALTPERQQVVLNRAASFLSTIMAIEFRSDGTMENEISLTPVGGQQLRDGRTGSWRVIEQNADQLVIETSEELADGTVITNQRLYEIAQDGTQIALMVPMNDELSDCNPMILFSRQQLSSSANLAKQPEAVQVK